MVALCLETKDNPPSSQCDQKMSWTIQNKQPSDPKTNLYCGTNKTFLGSLCLTAYLLCHIQKQQ